LLAVAIFDLRQPAQLVVLVKNCLKQNFKQATTAILS
jgi:hypothetical protein